MKINIKKGIQLLLSVLMMCAYQATIAQSKLEKIHHLLDSIFPKDQPGIAIGIVEDGKTIFANGFGLADIETKKNITAHSNFNIASLTKQFTAAAILNMQENGKLQFSDKLNKYFPDMNKQVSEKITIQQLLTHSSGIIDHYSFVQMDGISHGYAKQVYQSIKNSDSLYFSPGKSYRYSNTAYCLLGLILEKISGQDYKNVLKRTIFSPLEMVHSTVWNEQEKIFQVVTGYDKDSVFNRFVKSQAEEHIFFSTEGDGAIYTSVLDYIKWFQGLQKEKILNLNSIALARSIQNPIPDEIRLGYGYGWFVSKKQYPTYVYHSGDNGGFRTYSFSIPTLDYLVVIFANRSDINIENIVNQINLILNPALPPLTPIEALTS